LVEGHPIAVPSGEDKRRIIPRVRLCVVAVLDEFVRPISDARAQLGSL
jgi:hypothetical protein